MKRGDISRRLQSSLVSGTLSVWFVVQTCILLYLLWQAFMPTPAAIIASPLPAVSMASNAPTTAPVFLKTSFAPPAFASLQTNTSVSLDRIGGVAMTLLLHSPTWFQRRYTFMIENVASNVPSDWVVQVFHTNTGQSLKGLQINRGITRLVARGKVVLTAIPPEVWKAKRKRYELMTERWVWASVLAERVLVFGGSSIICSNAPRRLEHFA
ncbi:hypothetical protein EON64_18355, partial [archaeon]